MAPKPLATIRKRLDAPSEVIEMSAGARAAPRAGMALPLKLKVKAVDDVFSTRSLNISRNGLFIPMDDPAEIGTCYDLDIVLKSGQLLLHGVIEVARQQRNRYGTGVGARFVQISYESQALIDRLVEDEQRFFGRYRLETLIGRGGMAEVYRATVQEGARIGHVVAIKRILPELAQNPMFLDMFMREASLLHHLRHENIIEIFETGQIDGVYFIAMDFVDGCSLAQILDNAAEKRILLPVDFSVYLAHIVAEALNYAHTAVDDLDRPLKLVHRDVAPGNVFISDAGKILLGDFGVAVTRFVDSRGELAGKLSRMPPEQLKRKGVTPASDVFALGTILYQMLTNRNPLQGKNQKETKKRVRSGVKDPPSRYRPEIPEQLDEVVMRALAPRSPLTEEAGLFERLISGIDAEGPMRYADAESFANDLKELYDPAIANELAIASVVRNLGLGRTDARKVEKPEVEVEIPPLSELL